MENARSSLVWDYLLQQKYVDELFKRDLYDLGKKRKYRIPVSGERKWMQFWWMKRSSFRKRK